MKKNIVNILMLFSALEANAISKEVALRANLEGLRFTRALVQHGILKLGSAVPGAIPPLSIESGRGRDNAPDSDSRRKPLDYELITDPQTQAQTLLYGRCGATNAGRSNKPCLTEGEKTSIQINGVTADGGLLFVAQTSFTEQNVSLFQPKEKLSVSTQAVIRLPAGVVPQLVQCPADVCAGAISCLQTTLDTPIENISSSAQLGAMQSGRRYQLTQDIALNGTWTPLAPLEGVILDGKGYTIHNLNISQDDSRNPQLGVGLLSNMTTSVIQNLKFENATVRGRFRSGVPVGWMKDRNTCLYRVESKGTIQGQESIGGLAGESSGLISQSVAEVSVSRTATTDGKWLGGIVGKSDGSVTVSVARGDVVGGDGQYVGGIAGQGASISGSSSTGRVSGKSDVGGLVGILDGGTASGYLDRSFTKGEVRGEKNVGGLVGTLVSGRIENTYSQSNVAFNGSSPTESNNIGGLVGEVVGNSSYISNSYAAGRVQSISAAPTNVGGLVGGSPSTDRARDAYWDTQVSALATSVNGSGRTTAQMQAVPIEASTYVNWDFVDTWKVCAGGNYPVFKNGVCPVTVPLTVRLLVNGTRNPGVLNYGQNITVSWTSTGATSCESDFGGQNTPVSGSMLVPARALDYNIVCYGSSPMQFVSDTVTACMDATSPQVEDGACTVSFSDPQALVSQNPYTTRGPCHKVHVTLNSVQYHDLLNFRWVGLDVSGDPFNSQPPFSGSPRLIHKLSPDQGRNDLLCRPSNWRTASFRTITTLDSALRVATFTSCEHPDLIEPFAYNNDLTLTYHFWMLDKNGRNHYCKAPIRMTQRDFKFYPCLNQCGGPAGSICSNRVCNGTPPAIPIRGYWWDNH